jgi:5,10-methylenetetrahydrofolate reductase
MTENRLSLRTLTASRDRFIVVAEYVPLPGHRLTNFETFLKGYAQKRDQVPPDVVVGAMTIPQSPSGKASMSPADIFSLLAKKGLWADLDILPHVTTKDMNLDAIETYLVGLQKLGIESVLALTGDKPAQSKGVFEVDSIGLIQFIRQMNETAFEKARPGAFDKVHQFYIAAAVSQFKYTEASQMQQYFKMAKKIEVGADCLITQMGWDWRKSEELFQYLKEENISTPVYGNVYVLTTKTPAPRLMHEGKLPGCVVTKEFFEKLQGETIADSITRAAQQMAMYRDLGAVGVDLGGLFDFDMLLEIVQQAQEIGSNWREYRDNQDFGVAGGFYLYDENGRRRPLSKPKPTFSKRSFDFFHNAFLEPDRGLHNSLRRILGASKGLRKGAGGLYKLFYAGFEAPVKKMLFDCEECGDCFLVENFGICSMGKCEKGLDNVPCGDANPDGTCGSNEERQCVGELVYEAAASEGEEGLAKLQRQINPKRNVTLEGTASILNYMFGKDHTKKVNLIQIGESLHASIPTVGAAMQELIDRGSSAYEQTSGALNFILSTISGQVGHRADYLAVNVDKFGEDDPNLALELMRQYVQLVKQHGRHVPVCIDSSSDEVLKTGLEQWYKDAPSDIAVPLINSVKTYTMEEMLPLREKYPFQFVGLLMEEKDSQADGGFLVENLYALARKIFQTATSKYGFAPADIFFDTTVFPLAIDVPMAPGTPGYTYRAFEAIRKIMSDSEMKGVHTSLGISNSARDLPGRSIGVCRAYLAKAMEYGLDAAIVNVTHDYGFTEPAPDLLELVDAFAKQDGSAESTQKAIDLMGEFCRANRKKN